MLMCISLLSMKFLCMSEMAVVLTFVWMKILPSTRPNPRFAPQTWLSRTAIFSVDQWQLCEATYEAQISCRLSPYVLVWP